MIKMLCALRGIVQVYGKMIEAIRLLGGVTEWQRGMFLVPAAVFSMTSGRRSAGWRRGSFNHADAFSIYHPHLYKLWLYTN